MPKVYNSIIVPAPIEQVWSRIRDFHDFCGRRPWLLPVKKWVRVMGSQ